MICPNCKKEIQDGTKFCTYCGAKVTGEVSAPVQEPAQTPAAQPAPAVQQPQPIPAPAKSNKKLNTVLIIILVALLIIVAVVVTVLVMSRSKQTAQVSETTSAVTQVQETQASPARDSGSVQEPKNYVPAYTGYAYFSESSGRTWSRLRSAPRKNSTEVARIPDGAQVTVLSDQEYDSASNIYYVYVQYKGYHGWMRADFIE